MFYLIKETLVEVKAKEIGKDNTQYVVVLTSEEWLKNKDKFDMGIDIDIEESDIYSTKAEVNYDSLTGSFVIPNRNNISGDNEKFLRKTKIIFSNRKISDISDCF